MSPFPRLAAIALAALGAARAAQDGLALKPPMGWRSWNQFQTRATLATMMSGFAALVDTSRNIDGAPASLASLGYSDAGIDDGWQLCGSYGPQNWTYHDASGAPVVNSAKFPDFKAMCDAAHAVNLTCGWYGNNCGCSDHCTDLSCFAGDINAAIAFGFDSWKLDGCGREESIELFYTMSKWATAKAGRKPFLFENCHNGPNEPTRAPDWQPFHFYRASTDIAPVFGSILANVNEMPRLAAANLSFPGTWAYPDMLEVGITNKQYMPSYLTALWCIVSSPLVLGFDPADKATLDSVWSIITNREAIAIDQDYAGFSGTRFFESQTLVAMAPCGWWLSNCSWPSAQYWYKPLSNGDTAVLLVNNDDTPADLSLQFGDVPGLSANGKYALRDVNNKADLGTFTSSFLATAVASRDSVFLRFKGA